MRPRRTHRWVLAQLGLAVSLGACATSADGPVEVDAQQLSGAWVFTYADTPDLGMDALGGGLASIVDDCLLLGKAVVIWHADDLDQVQEIIDAVQSGEAPNVQLSGGGISLDEGSTLDDFPAEILAHCSPTELWYSSDEPIEIDAGT